MGTAFGVGVGLCTSWIIGPALHLPLKRAFEPCTNRVFNILWGERGCPWYGPSAHPQKHFATRTLRYKRAFGAHTRYASLDLFFGILGASGRGEGWRLVQYLCKTRRALHERHVWKTLTPQTSPPDPSLHLGAVVALVLLRARDFIADPYECFLFALGVVLPTFLRSRNSHILVMYGLFKP